MGQSFYRSNGETVQAMERGRSDVSPSAGGARLIAERITDPSVFSTLHREWDVLVSSSSASVFQTFDWLFSWWRHFGEGDNRQLLILTLRRRTQLVGIAPFFVQSWPLGRGRSVSQLRMLGCGVPSRSAEYELFADYPPSDFLDIIAARGFEQEVGASVAAFLNRCATRFAEISLENIPLDGVLYTRVFPQLDRSLFDVHEAAPERCPQLFIPSSVQECLATMTSGTRRKIQQARKAFSDGGFAFIESIDGADVLDEAFGQLADLHQRRWTSLGFPGVFSDPRFVAFQEEVAGRFMRNGWLWFKVARYNGEPIAARMSFRFGNRMYDYLSGFDHTMPGANRRPGLALLLCMMEDAERGNIDVIELLRGEESYKLELTSNLRHITNLRMRSNELYAFPPARIAFAARGAAGILRSLHKEWCLLQVQYRVHGPLFFLISYIRFILTRLRSVLIPTGAHSPSKHIHHNGQRPPAMDGYKLVEQAPVSRELPRT